MKQSPPVEEKPQKKAHSVKFKRNRSSRACEVCHARKVRCDATLHIPCTNCLTFGCECRFPEPKERKNARNKVKIEGDAATDEINGTASGDGMRGAGATPTAAPESGVLGFSHESGGGILTATGSVLSTTISTNRQHTKRKNEPLAAISARSARIDSQKLVQKNLSTLSYHGTSSLAVLLTDGKADRTPHFKLADYVPPTLKSTIDKTRLSLDTVQMEILRLRGAFHLPEKPLCDDLINSFFAHIYPMEPIIDRTSFMKQYEDGTISLLLLQSVLLAASRVTQNPLVFDSDDSNYLTSATFYQRAKALYDANFENDPLAVVQSLILFSRFWDGVDDVLGNSFYWTKLAVSVAQGYGFNRNLTSDISSYTPERVRISKILWWDLYIKDVSVSVAFGRPRSIQLEDCDVPMLKLEDFSPDLSTQDAESFIQLIRISEIMSIVLQEQYSVRAEKTKRHRDQLVITHCDMIMSSWRSNLPQGLQYSPKKHNSLTVNVLNLYYYYVVCLVHRSTMIKTAMLNGKQYPSEGIVFKASRIIAEITSKLLKSGDIRYCHPITIPIFFMACITFLCHMDSQNPGIAKSAKIGYSICLEALKEIGKSHLMAVLIHHSLDGFNKDPKAREAMVATARKNEGTQTNGAPTPAPPPVDVSIMQSFAQSPVTPFQRDTVPFSNSDAQQHQQHGGLGPMGSLISSQPSPPQHSPQSGFCVSAQQQPQPQPQPQQVQPQVQQPHLDAIEFPDLYLFTNTIPTNDANTFDPSELFPHGTHIGEMSRSENNSDGVTSNDFYLNLPEFEFQSFNNSISLQNLASLNSYLDPPPHDPESGSQTSGVQQGDSPASQSNIYSFVN